ncbi:O-antigen polymerase [Fictibacillus phosphorivorans]|uniref:O-antigen polymerase n=1 Tax=Fictibacillus phosphorivorans TaxID=1221500 RepID=UPI003AF7ED22
MGLASFSQILLNRYPWHGFYSINEINFGLIIILLGLAFFDLGSYFGKKLYENRSGKSQFLINMIISPTKTVLLGVLGFFVSLYVIKSTGGFNNLFLPRLLFESLFPTTMDFLINRTLLTIPIFVTLLSLLILFKNKLINKHFYFFFIFTIITLIFNVLINNPIVHPRYWFGSVFLSAILILIKWKRTSAFNWICFFLILMIIVFPYADYFRAENQQFDLKPISVVMSENGDYDAFQMILNTIKYVEIKGISYGAQLFGVIFFWLPRSLWAGKPHGSGATVAEELGYSFTNLSSPFWAESYINFGLVGVILILFLYGVFIRILHEGYQNSLENKASLVSFIAPYFAAYQFFFLRGDLLNSFAYLISVIFFFSLVIKIRKV